MNNRRKLLVVLGTGALAASFGSFAQQQGKVWRVGFLALRRSDSLNADSYGGFPRGMRELGYVEGKNLVIEWRFADGRSERLPGLAAELVQLKVDVIVTAGTPATSAAQKATTTVPIVIGNAGDPIASGFARTLARPGGNLTGSTDITADVIPKHVEFLLALVPKLSRVAVLTNPANSGHAAVLKSVRTAAQSAGVTVLPVEVANPDEVGAAFATMARERAGAFIVANDGLFMQERSQILELAANNRLPSTFTVPQYVEAGGLMSYGQNLAENFRRAATFVDKIFKGARPGDLPIEQATRFEFVINMKTAKTLGIKVPNSILVQATRVIE